MEKEILFNEDKAVGDISALELLKIISLSNNKEKLFNNHLIKDKLRSGLLLESITSQVEYYNEMLKYASPSEILSLYSAEYLNEFFSDKAHGFEYNFFVSLCNKEPNETVKFILNDNNLLKEFLNYDHYFCIIFDVLDYELLKKLLLKIYEDNTIIYNYSFISYCSKERMERLLNEEFDEALILKIINKIDSRVLSKFFQNDIRGYNIYKKIDIPYYLSRGVGFSHDISKDKEFFDRLKSSSFIDFRENINNAEKNIPNPIVIEERLLTYYDELIESYDSLNKIFKVYNLIFEKNDIFNNSSDYILNDEKLINLQNLYLANPFDKEEYICILRDITSKKLTEIIIDSIFRDNYYNVCLNIKEMIRYNSCLENKVLDQNKIDFYKQILNFDNLDNNTKIDIYNKLKNKHYNLIFYEDLRKLKDISYEKIKQNMLNPLNHKENLIKFDNEVEIYDYRNQEYIMLVRKESFFMENFTILRGCYSLISNENNLVYVGGSEEDYLYGYSTFKDDRILHVLETDSFSMPSFERPTNFVNRIMTPEEIIKGDYWYSEIQIANSRLENNEYMAMKPDYLVVFDKYDDKTINEAKRLNIPIVIITKRELTKEKRISFYLDEITDKYIYSSTYEPKRRARR